MDDYQQDTEAAPQPLEDSVPPEPASTAPPEESQAPEIPPLLEEEKRWRRRVQRFIRWAAGLLLIFALGFLAATLALYLPQSRQVSQVAGDRDQALERISDLENELADLEADLQVVEAARDSALAAQETADLQAHLLSALSDVYAAQLALVNDEIESARLSLRNTPATLEELRGLVDADQVDSIAAMQQRLDLALSVLEDDQEAALSDLEVLVTNLVKLENIYFVEP